MTRSSTTNGELDKPQYGTFAPVSDLSSLYQIFLRPLNGLGDIPFHGAPRRFGCAIGAVLFPLSGTGFYLQGPLLSFIPALIIIPLAFIAAITQWCFASSLYRSVFGKKADCCWLSDAETLTS